MGLLELKLWLDNTSDISQHTCTIALGHRVRYVKLYLPPVQHKHIARFCFRGAWLIVIWGQKDVELRGNLCVPHCTFQIEKAAHFHLCDRLPHGWRVFRYIPDRCICTSVSYLMRYGPEKTSAASGCIVM